MTINISLPEERSVLRPRISVIGVGGAGGNAVNNMIKSNLEGVDFLIANTDAQALESSSCIRRIQLGLNSTKGLGAGMRPDIGKIAAEETLKDIDSKLDECNMAFIAAGMGGGTGTGASPVIAKLAREKGILTVGVVTKPFHFEGIKRMQLAEQGIEELEEHVDTLIIIPNQNLFRIANEKTTWSDAFTMADDVLYAGVRGVTDLMVMPGLINLDFSDIKTVMSEMGKAMMGTGEAEGDGRATAAAESAMANPLIDDVSLKGAKGLIINITGGKDLTLYEVDEAANRIREEVEVDANIIFGSTCDERLGGKMRVSLVATGIETKKIKINPVQPSKPSINIDNSVYQRPVENLSSSTVFNNHQEVHENKESISNFDEPSKSIEKTEEINKSLFQENSEINNNFVNPIEKENFDRNLYEHHENISHNENLNEHHENTSHNENLNEHHENTSFEGHNHNVNDQENEINIHEKEVEANVHEQSQSKRISLFDAIDNEEKMQAPEQKENIKREPMLDSIHSEENLDNNLEESQESHVEEPEESLSNDIEEEINQEEELLDVPTFLRRQAN